MIKKISRFFRIQKKRLRHKIKHGIYRFLVAIHEGEIRFSLFYIVCTLLVLFLCVGFFFRSTHTKDSASTASVLGSELTHALRHAATDTLRTELDADVTLFLLPDPEDEAALSSFFKAPLYGLYLTGREVAYLPEFHASLSESFALGTPYIGGLSFSYNPKRLLYNRATDIMLLTEEGSYAALSDDALYYVVGTESVFHMFDYLSERTFHMLKILPKDANGTLLSDYTTQLLRGSEGSYVFADLYQNYLLHTAAENSAQQASEIILCKSLNTVALYSQLNFAGYFLIGCTLLFLGLAAFVRPSLRRTVIWFRIFLFHQKKRGKISIRGRIYTARAARRHAA